MSPSQRPEGPAGFQSPRAPGAALESDPSAPYRLELLGKWELTGPDGRRINSLLAQPKRLCLLAYLALQAEPVSRSRVVALFWPESDELQARNALSQSLHYLRRSLTKDAVESVPGDRIYVPAEMVSFDAREVVQSGSAGTVDVASLDFFPGWNADDTQPLQEWLDSTRRQIESVANLHAVPASDETAAPEGAAAGMGEGSPDQEGPDQESPAQERPNDERPAHDALSGAGALKRSWLLLGVSILTIVAILSVLAQRGQEAAPVAPPSTAPSTIVVLNPDVWPTGVAPQPELAPTILAEVVAALTPLPDVVVHTAPFADPREYAISAEAVGAERAILSRAAVVGIHLRLTDQEARAILTMYRGPQLSEARSAPPQDYRWDDGSYVAFGLPNAIADDLAEWLRSELSVDR